MGSILGQMETTPQPGEWCHITFPEKTSRSVTSHSELTGKVVSIDEDGVKLSDVVVEARSMHANPVLSRLPYVGRFYKNTGVGRQSVDSQTVALDEFERLDIITQAEAFQADPWAARDQTVIRELVAAVPGRH